MTPAAFILLILSICASVPALLIIIAAALEAVT